MNDPIQHYLLSVDVFLKSEDSQATLREPVYADKIVTKEQFEKIQEILK
jgi:hypothetical protein